MNEILGVVLLVLVFVVPIAFFRLRGILRERKIAQVIEEPFNKEWEAVLTQKVSYYKGLNEKDKLRFQELLSRFIYTTHINGGGGVDLTDELLVLVGASAVIPIFNFKGWPYNGLKEVVLVPNRVRHPADVNNNELSNITGMVYGNVKTDTMFLSATALKYGFENSRDSRHVGIHEFAHIIDDVDGIIDGVPAAYLTKDQIPVWKEIVETDIERILDGKTKTNPYGATNEAEFFAVLTEAFFENPRRLQKEHPKAYGLLSIVYKS
jgi:Mlc titration factor MtfA (ptsG expression regulator)